MFALFQNAVRPVEIIKDVCYDLFPSQSLSMREKSGGVLSFSIRADLPETHVISLEVKPEFTNKGLIANPISFVKNEELFLPVFYAFHIDKVSPLEYLFSKDILFLSSKDKICRMWIKKI